MKGPEKCRQKKKYRQQREAEEAAAYQMRAFPGTPDLRVYHCPYCSQWHLTSQEEEGG